MRSPRAAPTAMTNNMTVTATAVAIVTASRTSRRRFKTTFSAEIAAAMASGTATASGRRTSIGSVAQLPQFLGVDGPEPLVRLDGECEEEGGHGGLDDDVGERQRLYDGVDGQGVAGDVREVRRNAPDAEPDRQEQHVRGGLEDDEGDDLVDEVPAGDDAVEAARDDPRHDDVREDAQLRLRITKVCSRSSFTTRTNAATTSTPTKKLINAIVPDASTAPAGEPRGRTSARYDAPVARAPTPTITNPPAPSDSTVSVTSTGLSRRKTRNSPPR